jgi:glycogen operon protein
MLFPQQRERASPYHPSDRRFLDPIYLDLNTQRPPASGDTVAYTEIWQAKVKILAQRFAAFDQADPAFQKFIETGGLTLHRFATFQAIAQTRPGEPWQSWPAPLRSPAAAQVAAFARDHASEIQFQKYLQFLADTQFAAASTGLELGLFRDLAVGAAPDGAEAWAAGETLAHGAWIGAPPDPFSATGQNWHLPPPNPHAMTRIGYNNFATLLAANMRHAGILRIDHVMGLARLFWIPEGGTGADGAYVAYPLADLVGQLALESHRAKCMVIGEDLGTVPDGLRQSLHDANILSFRVLLFERQGDAFTPPDAYPALAAACVSTHDLPPLAGWLEGADLAERAALGLPPPDSDRAADRTELQKTLGTTTTADTITAAHATIAATPSALALVQADDLAGARIGVNLPGTDTERPNWRRRLATPVETLFTSETATAILDTMRDRAVPK